MGLRNHHSIPLRMDFESICVLQCPLLCPLLLRWKSGGGFHFPRLLETVTFYCVNTSYLVFSKYPFWWDRVGNDFSGWVPGYSRRWAIIGDSTKISTFTNLKLTQIMGSNHLLYFSSATLFAFKTVPHRRNVNQEKISVHSKHGCLLQCP